MMKGGKNKRKSVEGEQMNRCSGRCLLSKGEERGGKLDVQVTLEQVLVPINEPQHSFHYSWVPLTLGKSTLVQWVNSTWKIYLIHFLLYSYPGFVFESNFDEEYHPIFKHFWECWNLSKILFLAANIFLSYLVFYLWQPVSGHKLRSKQVLFQIDPWAGLIHVFEDGIAHSKIRVEY